MSPSDSDLRLILNEVLREDLREALERDAQEKDVTLNEAAVLILAARFRSRHQRTTNSGFRPSAERFKLQVSWELHRKIRMEAARQHGTVRGVTLSVLAEHYGLEPISSQRRRRSTA